MKYLKLNQIKESGSYIIQVFYKNERAFYNSETVDLIIGEDSKLKFETDDGLVDLTYSDEKEFANCLFFGPIFIPPVDDDLRQEFIDNAVIKDIIE